MMDLLLQIGLSNACFALVLAIAAMMLGAKSKRPHLAHFLWLLVFVKLVTPPLLSLPVLSYSTPAGNEVAPIQNVQGSSANSRTQALAGAPLSSDNQKTFPADKGKPSAFVSGLTDMWSSWKPWIAAIWISGSGVVLAWSIFRVHRFNRLLLSESVTAPDEVQDTAKRLAKRLRLKSIPKILTTSANLSPMVWWTGGKVRVILPTTLFEQMQAQQWQWILAHELAHVRRRDYLVRWLEWLACVFFWWNPVMWWAQRNLRAAEEICCDALVISSLNPKPHSYANSILRAVETLAYPALRPPAMASKINSGGFLERRFQMIVSKSMNQKNSPSWLRALALLCATAVLPLGIAAAEPDYEAVEKRLSKSVKKGDITEEQAEAMMKTLKKMAEGKSDRKEERDGRDERQVQMRKRIAEALKKGELTEEQAKERWEAIRKEAAGAKKGSDAKRKGDFDYEAIEKKIKAAVKAGKLTEEEAKAKWEAIRKKAAGAKKKSDGAKQKSDFDYEAIGKKIKAAVKAGKLTEEEAREKWEGIRKEAARKKSGNR